MNRFHRRHRRLPPLPRTIQNSPFCVRPQNLGLLLIRLKAEPICERDNVFFYFCRGPILTFLRLARRIALQSKCAHAYVLADANRLAGAIC